MTLTASAYANTCGNRSFELNINANSPTEIVLHNRSSRDLGAFLKTKALLGYVTQGLTVAKYQSGYSVEYSSQKLSDGSWCSRVSRLNVDFGLSDAPYIYVASELPRGGCLYNEVMKHEYQHLAISREMVKAGQSQLNIRLKGALSPNGARAKSADAATKIIETKIATAIESVTSRLYKIAEQKNARLDTPSNYAALGNICR